MSPRKNCLLSFLLGFEKKVVPLFFSICICSKASFDPIWTKNDVEYVWQSLQKNHIDTIGTDHVANQLKLKLDGDDVWSALAGFPGIGTSLPILLSEGVNKNRITLDHLVNLTSTNASKIFGLSDKGNIAPGFDADITMIDLKKEKKVSPELFGGFSDYLVYDGWNLKGWPVKTIVRGIG